MQTKAADPEQNVPPVFVELAVTKPQELSQDIESGMEEAVEEDEPDKMIRHLQSQSAFQGLLCQLHTKKDSTLCVYQKHFWKRNSKLVVYQL